MAHFTFTLSFARPPHILTRPDPIRPDPTRLD